MRGTVLGVGAVVLATASDHCGPTDQQLGAVVLLAAPVAFLLALGLNAVLGTLWRVLRPELKANGNVHAVAIVVLLAGAGAAGIRVAGASEWLGIGLWLFGSSYLTVYLVVWRIELTHAPRRAFTWAPVDALVIVLPALPLLFGARAQGLAPFIYLWVYAGLYGVLPVFLFIIFLVETSVRSKRAR